MSITLESAQLRAVSAETAAVRTPVIQRAPRRVMQKCSQRMTTPTPFGSRLFMSASAIWHVKRSCT